MLSRIAFVSTALVTIAACAGGATDSAGNGGASVAASTGTSTAQTASGSTTTGAGGASASTTTGTGGSSTSTTTGVGGASASTTTGAGGSSASTTTGAGGGIAGSCTKNADCVAPKECSYPIADGCSAKGTCVDIPMPANCGALIIEKGCGCIGQEVMWVGGCKPNEPNGYAPAPIVHTGPCAGP